MKIVHVNVCAKYGSTGKIVTDISSVLVENGHSVLICYGANETVIGENYYRFCNEFVRGLNAVTSRITGVMYGDFLSFSTDKLVRKITEYQPDIVHLHCINGYTVDVYRLFSYLTQEKIKTVLTLHAEFMYTANCSHAYDCMKWANEGCHNCSRAKQIAKSVFDGSEKSWNLMRRAFDNFDKDNLVITSVSPWLMERAMMSPFLKRFRHCTILNGLDDSIFCYKDLCSKYEHPNLRNYCLFVTASFNTDVYDNKGGYFVIELAHMMPDVCFVVASNYTNCKGSLPSNVIHLGRIKDSIELAELYRRAKMTIILSRRETFSMVTAESLCCGTPVVGFKAGGPESISLPNYSQFVEYGDVDNLADVIRTFLSIEWNRKKISEVASHCFSKKTMTIGYMDVYKTLMKGN